MMSSATLHVQLLHCRLEDVLKAPKQASPQDFPSSESEDVELDKSNVLVLGPTGKCFR